MKIWNTQCDTDDKSAAAAVSNHWLDIQQGGSWLLWMILLAPQSRNKNVGMASKMATKNTKEQGNDK